MDGVALYTNMSDLVDPHAHVLLELLQDGDDVQRGEPGLHAGRDSGPVWKQDQEDDDDTDNNKIWINKIVLNSYFETRK